MKKLLVPKKDVKVRDPITGEHLPPQGAMRNITSYYDRRIKDGDLEVREAEVVQAPAKSGANKKGGEK